MAVLSLLWSGRADWPMARGNPGRASASPEGPSGVLHPAWSMDAGAPAPAWPGEARGSLWQRLTNSLTARAADDLAPVPVIARGKVIFGTTQDEVRAVDLLSGTTAWQHFCGGPVRFAPVVADGRVYVGSDDGWVQALDAATGAVLWKTCVGPQRPRVAGNGRLISPCPIRTGVLVVDGAVYVAAGLFPLEGTYLAALDATDGSVQWRRHLGSDSPQGYLADAGTEILVPMGRASPKLYRKHNGDFVRAVPSASGTLAVVAGDQTLSGPGATGTMQAGDVRTGAKLVSYPGRQLAVTAERAFLVNGLELLALDRRRGGAPRPGKPEPGLVWKTECSGGNALIVAGGRVYCGTSLGVEVFEADTGRPLQSLEVGHPVVALAADTRGLVASARDGSVHAFLTVPSTNRAPVTRTKPPEADPAAIATVEAWLGGLPTRRGWMLSLRSPVPWSELPAWVARSELQIVLAVPEAELAVVRRRLADAGWLGHRVSALARSPGGELPVVGQLFNLVLADPPDRTEALRCAAPGPGGVVVIGGQAERLPPDARAGTWTHQYGSAANACASRQSLTGFPHLQWFGGHGPERMPDRHTRGHAPLAAGGVQVSMAENALIATDARNGTVRWQLELPESMRYVMPYDAGYAALAPDGRDLWVAVDAALWRIDAQRGAVDARFPVPETGRHWGWVALDGPALYASTLLPSAPRTEKRFELVDLEYRSERPLVTSKSILRLDPGAGGIRWTQPTVGAWVNPTLCAYQGCIYAVESRGTPARQDTVGRLTCRQILEDAWVVCLDGEDGHRRWEKPLVWASARDILGLSADGGRLYLSAAESVGEQAAYHLRCWSVEDGREHWVGQALNPVRDLYHGQQVKRPVLLGETVAFESGLFDAATGARRRPAGQGPDWILARPGHACGGMTGAEGGLLFRADNPTLFRLGDGSFTRLAPTRPGCWLNILPAEGGVLIPEASASCICGYPLQTSMGFAFGPEPVPMLPDRLPGRP